MRSLAKKDSNTISSGTLCDEGVLTVSVLDFAGTPFGSSTGGGLVLSPMKDSKSISSGTLFDGVERILAVLSAAIGAGPGRGPELSSPKKDSKTISSEKLFDAGIPTPAVLTLAGSFL